MKVDSASSNFDIVDNSTLQSISGLIGNGGGGSGPKQAAANRHPAAAKPSDGTAAAEGLSDAWSDLAMMVFELKCDDDSASSGSSFT